MVSRTVRTTVALPLVACGGQIGGTYAQGSVGDASFEPQSAIVSYFACPAHTDIATDQTTGPRSMAVVVLSEDPDTCALALDGGVQDATVPGLMFVMSGDVSSAGALLAPGSYPAFAFGSRALFSTSLASPPLYQGATSGTISLDSVAPSGAAGSFSLSFGAHGVLNGGFQASTCNVPDPGAVGISMGACSL